MQNSKMSAFGEGETWGWLVTMKEPVQVFSLGSPFTVGRNPSTCDLFINWELFNDNFGEEFEDEDYVRISRRHFIIDKEVGEDSAVLTDLSMNGTFVDGVRLGKDRKFILRHCSVISILGSGGDCFRYLDRDTMEDI